MLRLPEHTPIYNAFNESLKYNKVVKKNKKTWRKLVNEDLKLINKDLSLDRADIRNLAEDREWWRGNVVNESWQCLPQT